MNKSAVLLSAALLAFAAAPVALAADSACAGQVATVRISKLSPTGTLDGYKKAVADHQAWYTAHNDPTKIIFSESGDQLISVTIHPDPKTPMAAPDAAYKAFVAEYNANSQIVVSGSACLTDAEAQYKKQHQ
jgi:hypothetical protein